MIEEFQKIRKCIDSKKFILHNHAAIEVIQDYNFIHISEQISFDGKEEEEEKEKEFKIYQNISNSKVIVIDQNKKFDKLVNQKYYILGFEKTIILLKESSLSFLQQLLSSNPNIPICFLNSKDDYFSKNIKNPEITNNEFFKEEIKSLNNFFHLSNLTRQMKRIWKFIVPCISGYLIKKSYLQLNDHRISNFIENIEKPLENKVIKEEDCVKLRNVGKGSSFTCVLIYHIIHEKMYVIKKPNIYNAEFRKLIEREKENYLRFSHPLLPTFYGTVENKDYIVIEFINGRTLSNINKNQFSADDVFHIIYEIITVIKYFHSNNYIYRDLKANNIIIDENKSAVLIDLDRLIEYDPSIVHTSDLINASENPSFDDDIRCLRETIQFILQETEDSHYAANEISKMFNEEANLSISDIIDVFDTIFECEMKTSEEYEEYLSNFKILNILSTKYEQNRNDRNMYFNLGFIYSTGDHVPIDINKAIHYYSLASNQNLAEAQYNLGFIYHTGYHVPIYIDKAIHYYSLAANQNFPEAQYCLGIMYYLRNFSITNMKKSILYIILSSKNGNREANFAHGYLLHEGKYIKRNIEEAVHYLKEASSFNNQFAKNNLGILYKHGFEEEVPQRISQSIEYFEEAIKQKGDYLSMYNLSHIYFYDQSIKQNFNLLDLLIKSCKIFKESFVLLSLVLIDKFCSDIEQMETELEKRADASNDLTSKIINYILDHNLFDPKSFDQFYNFYRDRDYLYNILHEPILTSELNKKDREEKEPKYRNMKELSNEFYEGFGHDLM